jgi:hypothetical protein
LPSSLATDRLELTAAARMLCASLVLFVWNAQGMGICSSNSCICRILLSYSSSEFSFFLTLQLINSIYFYVYFSLIPKDNIWFFVFPFVFLFRYISLFYETLKVHDNGEELYL